jgi:hypothetical protein
MNHRTVTSIFVAFLFCAHVNVAQGNNISLAWDPSPEPEIACYLLYVGTNSGIYSRTNVYAGTQTFATVSNMTPETVYFFSVTAFASNGMQSDSSSELVYTNAIAPTPPVISRITDQSMTLNSTLPPIAFTISDTDTPLNNLVLSAASSNPNLVPTANIQLKGSGSNWTATITAKAKRTGQTIITLYVSDGVSVAQTSFTVTVTKSSGALTMFASTTPSPAQISISQPTTAMLFLMGNHLELGASLADTNQAVSKVEFYADDQPVAVSTNQSGKQFLGIWQNAAAGVHQLSALAKTADGTILKSRYFKVTIIALPAPMDALAPVTVESSINLTTWTLEPSAASQTGVYQYEADPSAAPVKFYRLR